VLVRDRPPIPNKSDLPDHGPFEKEGEGWSEYITVPVADLEGRYPQMDLGVSSKGGTNALARLMKEYGTKVSMNIDENGTRKMPVVEIGANAFESQKAVGVKYAPTFKIVGWISVGQMDKIAAARADNITDEDADEQEAAPAPAPAPAQAAASPKQGFQANRIGKRV
jgi:hypothetical protein